MTTVLTTTMGTRAGLLCCGVLIAATGCTAPMQPAAGRQLVPAASPAASETPEEPGEAAVPAVDKIPDPAEIPVRLAAPLTAASEEAPPTRLLVAGTSIDVRVVDVGVNTDNAMEIPESVEQAGWYRYGAVPGDRTGTAVIAAHVDTLAGLAPFSELRQLEQGTRITVERAAADPVTYRVTEVALMDKDDFDGNGIFRRDGQPLLKLVTCGGQWLDAREDYSHNVVVTAVPD